MTKRSAKAAAAARRARPFRRCRACGCTDRRACAGGCCWVEADLCSACAVADLRRRIVESRGGVGVRTDIGSDILLEDPILLSTVETRDRARQIVELTIANDAEAFARCLDAISVAVMPPPFPGDMEHPAESQMRLSLAAEVLEALGRAGFDVARLSSPSAPEAGPRGPAASGAEPTCPGSARCH